MQGTHKGFKGLMTTRKETEHTWDLWNMNTLRREWRQKAQAQSLAWLMALRPEASSTELGTGHKSDMAPDAREIMRTWYGTFMGHIGHKLNGIQWGQNFLLIGKVKDLSSRLWYMQKSEYELTRTLPTIEEIEAELGGKEAGDGE